MSHLGKFLLGCTVVGAAAAGVYYYLEQNYGRKTGTAAPASPEGETPEAVKEAEPEVFVAEASAEDAAERAYTTIRHSADEMVTTVKDTIVPKGEEVLDVVAETAEKMVGVVTESAEKVIDIISKEESKAEPEAEEVVSETAAPAEQAPVDAGDAEILEEAVEEFFSEDAVTEEKTNEA